MKYLDDTGVSNEMVKEHLMSLSLQSDIESKFQKIDTRTKTAFTKEYNKTHKEITKLGTTKGKKGAKEEE